MIKIEYISEMIDIRKKLIQKDNSVGFVPTMGALHEGHLSLIKESKQKNDITIVSIFLNPLQFGENEDLDKYPAPIKNDISLLKNLDTDFVFIPNRNEMYKEKPKTIIEIPTMFNILCGKKRPGHFNGVCLVVAKLLNIIQPNNMYMGIKDYQQLCIIKKMVEDLNFNCNVIGLPIIRDENGLALSSRNSYLNDIEKQKALQINKSRNIIGELLNKGIQEPNIIIEKIKDKLESVGLRIDYVEMRESITLEETNKIMDLSRIFIAVYSGNTRLIDNFTIEECKLFFEN